MVFTDGSGVRADVVITCTGFGLRLPEGLDPRTVLTADGRIALYHRVAAPRHPGLFVVGWVKPFGSATRLMEAQADWVADLITGQAALPDVEVMDAEISAWLDRSERFGRTATATLQVTPGAYLRDLRAEHDAARDRATACASGSV